jgi:hypothetical protein
LDLRWRLRYDYDERADDLEPSLNLLLGLRRPADVFGISVLDAIYLRWYHGVNPHGQLRSQRSYDVFGIGLNFAL